MLQPVPNTRNPDGFIPILRYPGAIPQLLLMCGVLLIFFCHLRLLVIAVVNKHAIAKLNRLSRRNHIAAILVRIVKEKAKPKGIRREQSVTASVPISGVPETFWTIEDSDAKRLPIDNAVNIDPVGAFAPYLRLPYAAL